MFYSNSPKQVLSITSHVSSGHVGGQATILPLQRLGCEVCHIPTVLFSNHPGHGNYGGGPVKLTRVKDLIDNLVIGSLVANSDAIHSGYMGQGGIEPSILYCLKHIRKTRPDAIYLCDPVLGDKGRIYVPDEVLVGIRDCLVPAADIITPNKFELGLLVGRALVDSDDVLLACKQIKCKGPQSIVCTTAEENNETLTLIISDSSGDWAIDVPYIENAPFGTGDTFSAILLGRILMGYSLVDASLLAAASLQGIIRHSLRAKTPELPIVSAQDEVIAPSFKFQARKLTTTS